MAASPSGPPLSSPIGSVPVGITVPGAEIIYDGCVPGHDRAVDVFRQSPTERLSTRPHEMRLELCVGSAHWTQGPA